MTGGFPGLLCPPPPQPPLSQSRSLHRVPLPAPTARGLGPAPRRHPAQVARAWRGNQTWRARRRGARARAKGKFIQGTSSLRLRGPEHERRGQGARARARARALSPHWLLPEIGGAEELPHWPERDGRGGAVSILGCAFAFARGRGQRFRLVVPAAGEGKAATAASGAVGSRAGSWGLAG